ncbi:MAG: AsmA-like C-terminal region-containing protein [Siculibacillus sp.]
MTADALVEPGRGRRLLARCGVGLLWFAATLSALLGISAVALTIVFAQGPVEAETAARAAESVLSELAGAGAHARVGTARLEWSIADGLTVDLAEIAVERGPGLTLELPRATLRLRMLPIFVGEVRPRALVLQDPAVIVDTADLLAATGSDPAAPVASVPPSTRLAEAIGGAIDRAAAAARGQGFETFGLRNGRLEVRHRSPDAPVRTIVFSEIDVEGVLDGPAGEFDAGVTARGEVGRWSMRLTQQRQPDGGRSLAFVADDVTLHDLIGPGSPGFVMGSPFYPRLKLVFGREGAFTGADLDLRLGAGVFRFGREREDEILLDELLIQSTWKAQERVFDIAQLTIAVGETGATLHGAIRPPPLPGGIWAFDLVADGGALKPRDVRGPTVPIVAGSGSGQWNPQTSVLDINPASVTFGSATLNAVLRLDLTGEEPRLEGDLQFSPMSVAEVAHAWPHWVAPDARTWFARNVSAGRVSETRIRLDMPRFDRPETWPGNAFRMTGRFDGLRFDPLGNLPAVVGGEGRLSIAERRFEAFVEKAQVATKAARHPTADGMRFSVADIFAKPAKANFRLQVVGEVPALAEIVDAEPLAVLQQSGVAAGGLGGTGTIAANVDVVFAKPFDERGLDYRIEANLDGFSSTNPIQGRKFQDGKFKIVADPRGLDVSGRAVVDGVPADVHVHDPRGASKKDERRDFKMAVDDAARQRLGIDLGGMVEGAIGLSVSQPNPNELRSRIEADLGPVKLMLAPLGWTKGSGVPAKAVFDLWDDDKGVHIDNFALESEGLSIRGSVLLDRDRNIVSADFTRFNLRKGDNAKLKLARGADKALTIALDAAAFDARGLILAARRPASGEASPTPSPDLVLKLKVGRLTGLNDVVFADVSVDGRLRGGAFGQLEARARSPGRRPLNVAIKPEGGQRRFTVATEDAGAVLSFFDLFDRIGDGTMTLSARLGAPGVSEGVLRLVDFHLLEEPKTGRTNATREAADGTRQIQVRKVEIDRSTNFDRASVRFSMRDGVINVGEAVAKGISVGATASGQIDLNNQRLSLSGTYIPAFGLNNLAGRIPVLGAIAGAGSNEGLVGVTFRVVGAIEDPILQINPLSAVAPGIFRKIFEYQNQEMPKGGGDPNAPTRLSPSDGAPTKITP